VYSWDLRADVGAPVVVYSPTDSVSDPLVGDTNQKRRFDVDITGRLLGVGNQVLFSQPSLLTPPMLMRIRRVTLAFLICQERRGRRYRFWTLQPLNHA
jgi:hypothetical protein